MNNSAPLSTKPIKIVQLNVQRKKHIVTQLLNNSTTDIDVLLIQEPAWSFIGHDPTSGTDILGPVTLQGWSILLPVASQDADAPCPWTMTYYRPRSDFSIALRTDLLEDRDIQILEIAQTNHPTTSIINIYNDSPKGDLCILNHLRAAHPSLPNQPTLITGDFNLHHPLWSRDDRDLEQDQLANRIADWLAELNYSMLNKKGEITHLARHARECPSVIDLSFANQEATCLDTFKHWSIDPSLSLDSDHNAIIFTLDHGLQEIPNLLPIKFNVKKADPAEWTKAFEQELEMAEPIISPLLASESLSEEQLDLYAKRSPRPSKTPCTPRPRKEDPPPTPSHGGTRTSLTPPEPLPMLGQPSRPSKTSPGNTTSTYIPNSFNTATSSNAFASSRRNNG